jgi:lambda family phage minor tail protein L
MSNTVSTYYNQVDGNYNPVDYPIQISSGKAFVSSMNIASEAMSLSPSALITMFIIDVSSLGFNVGSISATEVALGLNTAFLFHNNINITTSSLFWQGNTYVAAPIIAEGFETNLKGPPTTPTLSITVSDQGIPQLTLLKQRIRQLGNDIVGAKVIRIRTFARFLDASNFFNGIPPTNFNPDPTQELPRDIWYINRLANEDKNSIQYELSPLFILDDITLPGRIISENVCTWQYRGEGCLYEYSGRKSYVHGNGTLPQYAPPVATYLDEQMTNIVTGTAFVDVGAYNIGQTYSIGQTVYISNRGINYYFVSAINNNNTTPPSTSGTWIQEDCSKTLLGCKYRWANQGSGILPYGGFPSVNRFQ